MPGDQFTHAGEPRIPLGGFSMSTVAIPQKNVKLVRGSGWFVTIVGVIMIICGISVWVYTSSSLSDQGIKVAAVTKDDPGSFAGETVNSPWTALAQANAIQHHTDTATGDRTYAEIPGVTLIPSYSVDADGKVTVTQNVKDADGNLVPATEQQIKDAAARPTAQTGALLQSSLFLSVMAFGVAFLIFGLGIVFIVLGLMFLFMLPKSKKGAAAPVEAKKADATA